MESTRECPFCECYDVRVMFRGDDGSRAYRCHQCQRVFHTRFVGEGRGYEASAVASPSTQKNDQRSWR